MKNKEQIAELINEVELLKIKNQDLLDLTIRLGNENQQLKGGMREMAAAAYDAVFEACHYGEIGSNSSWFDAYAAYGKVGNVFGKYIIQKEEDKDSMLWGNQKI